MNEHKKPLRNFIENGFFLLPYCLEGGKTARDHNGRRVLYKEREERENSRIDSIDKLRPYYDRGIRKYGTYVKDNNHVLIDLDRNHKDGADGVKSFYDYCHKENIYIPPWEEITHVKTPSGGLHLYFRYTGKKVFKSKAFLPGVDIKYKGIGYIGSKKNGSYRLYGDMGNTPILPVQLVERIEAHPPEDRPYSAAVPYRHPGEERGAYALNHVFEFTRKDCGEMVPGNLNYFDCVFIGKARKKGFSNSDIESYLIGKRPESKDYIKKRVRGL